MRLAAASFALLFAGVAATGALAKSSDRNQAMDILADHSDALMQDDGESVLTGNVRITQGTLDVQADKAVVARKAGEIERVVLTGTPAELRQVGDNGEPMTARARQIVYTLSSDVVVLTGAVEVEQPRGNLRGETIKYDMKSGRLDGGGDGSRVSMRILPKSAAPADPAKTD